MTARYLPRPKYVLEVFSINIYGTKRPLELELKGGHTADAAERRGLLRRCQVGKDGREADRVTTTLSRHQKAELERLAKAEGVKVAWLVRRAVDRFLEQASGGPMLPLDYRGDEHA